MLSNVDVGKNNIIIKTYLTKYNLIIPKEILSGGKRKQKRKTMKKRRRKTRKLMKKYQKGGYTYSTSKDLDKASSVISNSSKSLNSLNSKSMSKSNSRSRSKFNRNKKSRRRSRHQSSK